ncbi:MAG: hypothetical protein V1792_02835, partial [Pseudomonadota bacterium]
MRGNGEGHEEDAPRRRGGEPVSPVNGHEEPVGVVRLVAASFMLAAAVALVPIALDWRSPVFLVVRPWVLIGLFVVSAGVIVAEAKILRTSSPGQRMLRILSAAGLLAAVLVPVITLVVEARFRWASYQVMHADPARMERLGRHIV